MSPTPAGEGKTTTSVGLADALRRLGEKSVVALREPSMGPVFGIKGGAAGGGYSQVVPMVDINLAFTGDFAAIAAANNLLSAMLDNHLHFGNALDIDPRTVTWKRVVDLNDRALRDIVVGLGGVANGIPREDGFDIVVASEVMAILCMADSLPDLKRRLGDIVVGYTRGKEQVTARDLRAEGAMTVLLRDALAPNLVQTLEHTPAFIHGGPFANIAHGCNSVMATRAALKLGDWVVTEAGFGADLGAEKFIDIKCRASGLRPEVAVVVVTIRALKVHGGVPVADVDREDLASVGAGMTNLRRHLENVRGVYGLTPVVAVNRFPSDTDAEVDLVVRMCSHEGVRAYEATHVRDGGGGAEALARGVVRGRARGQERDAFRLRRPPVAREEGRGGRDPRLRRGAGGVRAQGPSSPRPDRGRRLRAPADLHGQDPVVVLDRRLPARRPLGSHRDRARGAARRRRRLRRPAHRGDHDDAGPAPRAGCAPHRRRRRRTGGRPQLSGSGAAVGDHRAAVEAPGHEDAVTVVARADADDSRDAPDLDVAARLVEPGRAEPAAHVEHRDLDP